MSKNENKFIRLKSGVIIFGAKSIPKKRLKKLKEKIEKAKNDQ